MVCHEMAFLPPPPSDHHQYFLHHHPQLHNPQDFLGGVHDPSSLAMMNHHHHHQHQMTSPVVSSHVRGDVDHDDLSDDGSQLVLGEKKKRLSLEQVKTLEKNFELGNKLEPERKLQLAKALGLQPRQVAIWFQNRRARWKTKQLEKDYNVLKRQFDAIRSDNDSLLSLNKKLHSELLALKSGTTATNPTTSAPERAEFGSINLNTTTTTTKSYCNWSNNGSEISSDINLGMSTTISPTSHHHEESPSSNNKMQFAAPHFLPTSLTDLLTSSSSTPKPSDHPHHQIQDDTFCSLFGGGGAGGGGGGGVGDQTPFWAWAPNSLN